MIVFSFHMKKMMWNLSDYRTLKSLKIEAEIVDYKKKIMGEERVVSTDQAVSITKAYKEYPDKPVVLQRAKAFARSLREIRIRIDPEERVIFELWKTEILSCWKPVPVSLSWSGSI